METKVKKKFHQYSEQNLQSAIQSIRTGTKTREACKIFGVPRSTVQDRLKGRVSEKPRQVGPDPYLTLKNENRIVSCLFELAKCGFPLKKQELLETVQKIVKEENIQTPFKDGKPGQTWYSSFLRRHKEI